MKRIYKRKKRQDTAYLMVRCSPQDLARYQALAARRGYRQLSPYVRWVLDAQEAAA